MNEGPGKKIQEHVHTKVPYLFRKRKASVVEGEVNALCRLESPRICQILYYSSHMECLGIFSCINLLREDFSLVMVFNKTDN